MNKILLTGHNGFLGQYICQRARQKNIQIIGVSRTINPELQVTELQLDLSKDNFINQLNGHTFDGIVHLAANGNIQDCEENAAESQKINVQASRLLAETAMQRKMICSRSVMSVSISTFWRRNKKVVSCISIYAIKTKNTVSVMAVQNAMARFVTVALLMSGQPWLMKNRGWVTGKSIPLLAKIANIPSFLLLRVNQNLLCLKK